MKGIHATLAALLLGCGAYAPGVGAAELPAFDVVARDGRLLPERLEVPAGVKLKINVRNEGRMPVEFESTELRIEKVLAGGASSFVVIHPLKPGSYTFVDEFHEDTGRMQLIAK